MKKIIAITAIVALLVVSLSAFKAPEPKNLLQKIKANKVIKIGTEGTYAPFNFHDASGKLTGFDVDIAKEVARRLGARAEFVETK